MFVERDGTKVESQKSSCISAAIHISVVNPRFLAILYRPWRVSSTESIAHADTPTAAQGSQHPPRHIPLLPLSRPPLSPEHHVRASSVGILQLTIAAHRTFTSLKSSLLPALQPLAQTLPISLPASPDDIQFWEFTNSSSAGEEGDAAAAGAAGEQKTLRCLENDPGIAGRDIKQLGWPRWKAILVRWVELPFLIAVGANHAMYSFKGEDGSFKEPIYTIPDPDDDYGGSEAEA